MMTSKGPGPGKTAGGRTGKEKIDQIVSGARKAQSEREKGYREKSLKIHPLVCARCGREFTSKNLQMLTVHHKDHDHDNNPSDGSNWENLCLYCHDNEHSRYLDHLAAKGTEAGGDEKGAATYKAFANLKDLLKAKE